MVMFLDHAKQEVYNGIELNDVKNHIKCYYSGNLQKFGGANKYSIFEPFPPEFGIQSNGGGFSPLVHNPNILLIPNLFLYEYPVFLLYGERIACSPYKKFGYIEPEDGISSEERGFNRGYYQYSLKYDGLSKER